MSWGTQKLTRDNPFRPSGWIADAAEIAATPALIQLCVKGIEKEGKAEFKVFGKEHSLTLDKPSKPTTTRPPSSSHVRSKLTGASSLGLSCKSILMICKHHLVFTQNQHILPSLKAGRL